MEQVVGERRLSKLSRRDTLAQLHHRQLHHGAT